MYLHLFLCVCLSQRIVMDESCCCCIHYHQFHVHLVWMHLPFSSICLSNTRRRVKSLFSIIHYTKDVGLPGCWLKRGVLHGTPLAFGLKRNAPFWTNHMHRICGSQVPNCEWKGLCVIMWCDDVWCVFAYILWYDFYVIECQIVCKCCLSNWLRTVMCELALELNSSVWHGVRNDAAHEMGN